MAQEVRNIRRQKLPNGLTVITEQMQHIRSASIGVWLQTGSRDEDPVWNGISHFIEHMVFKGTKHRTAEEIARQVDSIGGNMRAKYRLYVRGNKRGGRRIVSESIHTNRDSPRATAGWSQKR